MGIQDDRTLTNKLCEISRGLSDWEVEFVEGTARQVHDDGRALTPAQRKIAAALYVRFFESEEEDEEEEDAE